MSLSSEGGAKETISFPLESLSLSDVDAAVALQTSSEKTREDVVNVDEEELEDEELESNYVRSTESGEEQQGDRKVWFPWGEDRRLTTDPHPMAEIVENFLYLGCVKQASDRLYLKQRNIKRVLCLIDSGYRRGKDTISPPSSLHTEVIEVLGERCEFNRLWIPVRDVNSCDISKVFDECFQFLNEAKANQERVLVHCVAGRSRSTTIVLAYLMQFHNMRFNEAYLHVRSKRSIIRPNDGFIRILGELEKKLFNVEKPSMNIAELPSIIKRRALNRLEHKKPMENSLDWAKSVLFDDPSLLESSLKDTIEKHRNELTAPKKKKIVIDPVQDDNGNDFVDKLPPNFNRLIPHFLERVHANAWVKTREFLEKEGYGWEHLKIPLAKVAKEWYFSNMDMAKRVYDRIDQPTN